MRDGKMAATTDSLFKFPWWLLVYAGKVKRFNVCKRHVAIDTGGKQTEHNIFLHVISMDKTAFKCTFKETKPKL